MRFSAQVQVLASVHAAQLLEHVTAKVASKSGDNSQVPALQEPEERENPETHAVQTDGLLHAEHAEGHIIVLARIRAVCDAKVTVLRQTPLLRRTRQHTHPVIVVPVL